MKNVLTILTILIGGYLVLTGIDALLADTTIDWQLRGRIRLALVFLFTALGHFVQPQPMVDMLPPWVPGRLPIIYLMGLLAIVGAIGLLLPRLAWLAGLCLIAFLILVLPSNIYAALKRMGMGDIGKGLPICGGVSLSN